MISENFLKQNDLFLQINSSCIYIYLFIYLFISAVKRLIAFKI